MSHKPRIVFMGTPQIAVAALKAIHIAGYTPLAVVTTPDKPAGRGLKMHVSPVKQFADENAFPVLQPETLNDPGFLTQVRDLQPDLIVVVAFRKLPVELLQVPAVGSFNLHASLLPQYRGAAPINWAIINGETETGVTTFLLNEKIDAGKILYQEKVSIAESMTASQLHDVLMTAGADLVVRTIRSFENDEWVAVDQNTLIHNEKLLKKAPKIFKEDCRISWNKNVREIYDFIRGLSLYPAAFTELISPEHVHYYLKVLSASYESSESEIKAGSIETDGSMYLRLKANDGFLYLKQVQLSGKKPMEIKEFLRGFKLNNSWYA